jgi:hypothetical protein
MGWFSDDIINIKRERELEKINKSITDLYNMFETFVNAYSAKSKCKLERITTDELWGCYCTTHDKHSVVNKGDE